MATAKYVILIENSKIEDISHYLEDKLVSDAFQKKNSAIDISDETANLKYTYTFHKKRNLLEDPFFENHYNSNSNYIGIFIYTRFNDDLRNYLVNFCDYLSQNIDANVYFSETNILECLFFPCK